MLGKNRARYPTERPPGPLLRLLPLDDTRKLEPPPARRRQGRADAGPRRAERQPRFVVTSPNAVRADARTLYEQMYRARGEMENRIKECQLDLFAEIGVPITPDCAPDPQPPRPSFNANNAPHHTHCAEAQCAAVSDPCAAVARGSLIPSLAAFTKVPVRNAG
jgi:hypothetical protein